MTEMINDFLPPVSIMIYLLNKYKHDVFFREACWSMMGMTHIWYSSVLTIQMACLMR